jgi:sn-glycerol 3-phosphate transport system substrate-binding protein
VHKASGYLPITKAAYAKTKESGYYKENPYLETPLLELTNKEPTENSRGLRLGNMVQLRDVWAEEVEAALAGQEERQEAPRPRGLAVGKHDAAQFERTVTK